MNPREIDDEHDAEHEHAEAPDQPRVQIVQPSQATNWKYQANDMDSNEWARGPSKAEAVEELQERLRERYSRQRGHDSHGGCERCGKPVEKPILCHGLKVCEDCARPVPGEFGIHDGIEEADE